MKIAILGIGAVGKCCLHLLNEFLDIHPHDLYLVERSNQTGHYTVNAFIALGAHFIERQLTCDNTLATLQNDIGLEPGDLVIDLTTDADMFFTVRLCLENRWLYLNTCIENAADDQLLHYRNHEKMAALVAPFEAAPEMASCLFDQGMNPGLISAFAKQGLLDIAEHVLASRADAPLEGMLAASDFSGLARHLHVQAIHCSELDTQTATGFSTEAFVNTWSCPGFLIEALAPVQLAWGTHEVTQPDGMVLVRERTAVIETPAWQARARSYVPHREIQGMLIPHEEIFTLRKLLEQPDYAPTICFVYEVNEHTKHCLQAGLSGAETGIVLNPAEHALQGDDRVGLLFVLAANPLSGESSPWCWWSGSILKTSDPLYSATVIQVAAGVLAGAKYLMQNPKRGVLFPEDLPHDTVLRDAAPFLGEIFSGPVDFHPAGTGFENFSSKGLRPSEDC